MKLIDFFQSAVIPSEARDLTRFEILPDFGGSSLSAQLGMTVLQCGIHRSGSCRTRDDGGKIDAGAHGGFIKAAEFLEPAKEGFTSSMSKRPFPCRFAHAGSLSDHHHAADDGTARDGRGNDSRTTPATAKACDVIFQFLPTRGH